MTSDKRTLLRVVRQPENSSGTVIYDITGKAAGRGAYVCSEEKCIALAQKQRRFERALSVTSEKIPESLFDSLRQSASEKLASAAEATRTI
jgi:predicted RNA-binding protein YlxR (DUF448 family)